MGSLSHKVYLLVIREFISLVLLANLLAQPLSYMVVNVFSLVFAYQANISAWMFIITFLFTLALSIATVGFHAFRVARTNPVESLRYE